VLEINVRIRDHRVMSLPGRSAPPREPCGRTSGPGLRGVGFESTGSMRSR
jgi:hypothetical protein